MSDPVHPDQPYTPSTDEELRWAIEVVLSGHLSAKPRANGSIPCECGDQSGKSRFGHTVDVLLPLIASVRREARAEQRERDAVIAEGQQPEVITGDHMGIVLGEPIKVVYMPTLRSDQITRLDVAAAIRRTSEDQEN